jgi:O-antigen ligase
MTTRVLSRGVDGDVIVATAATIALGLGLAVAAGAAFGGSVMPVLLGGALAAVGLVTLIAAGWLDGLAIAVLAIPLPALVSSDELRVAAAAPLTAVVIFAWLVSARSSKSTPHVRAVRYATVALLAAFALSIAAGSSMLTSVRELINVIVLFAFFLLAIEHARVPRSADTALTIVIASAAVCGVLAVLEMVAILPAQFPRWGTPFFRAALGFGQPNGLGLFFAVTLPMCVHAFRSHRGAARAAAAFALVATAAGLFATFSRGAWLAVIAGSLALAFVRDTRMLWRFLLGVIVFGVLLDVVTGGMIRDTAQRTLTDWVIEQRAALMLAGVMMFLAHPILGVGAGGFAVELGSYGAQIPTLWDYLPTPHNAYVQMAAETGAIGLTAFIVFLTVVFVQLVRRAREAASSAASANELSLRRCLLWSFATACCAGMVVWPYAHGTGQAVLLLAAIGLSRTSEVT